MPLYSEFIEIIPQISTCSRLCNDVINKVKEKAVRKLKKEQQQKQNWWRGSCVSFSNDFICIIYMHGRLFAGVGSSTSRYRQVKVIDRHPSWPHRTQTYRLSATTPDTTAQLHLILAIGPAQTLVDQSPIPFPIITVSSLPANQFGRDILHICSCKQNHQLLIPF